MYIFILPVVVIYEYNFRAHDEITSYVKKIIRVTEER